MTHAEPDPVTRATWNEIRPILDAELDALPDEARRLLIACYLEEKTYSEAAAELRLPPGSIGWHLQRARTLLAKRLARRGITVSGVLLAVLLENAAKGAGVPAVLLVHTLEAARTFTEHAAGIVSDNVTQLVKGGLAQMTKPSMHFGILLASGVGLLGAGLIACQTLKAWPDQIPESATPAAQRPAQEAKKPARTDCFDDPLPPGALARMGTVRLFNGEKDSNRSRLLAFAFSPDGKILASHNDGMTVALWDAATGREIRRLTTDAVKGEINSLGFYPDGKTLVTVTWDHRVCRWEVATGKLLRTDSKRSNTQVCGMAFLPDGRMLAATYRSVWDVTSGKEVCQLGESRTNPFIEAAAFSQDGKLLATAEEKNNIYLWDVATGKEIRHLTHNAGHPENVVGLAFSRDGKTLASADNQTISVWDVTSGKLLRQLKTPSHIVRGAALAFSPDGKILVGGQEGHLWEVSTGKEIRSLGLKNAKVALFSPDGKTLVVGDEAGVIRLWDMSTGKEIFPHPGHQQRITTVIYAPDGKSLASIGADEIVRLWDVATGKELRQLAKHNRWGSGVIAYSPDGKMLVSTEYNMVHLWDTATGKAIRHFQAPNNEDHFNSVAFSPDGKFVAASTPQTIFLWEAATGKEVYTLEKKTENGNLTWVLAFSPDGRMLATPGKDQNSVSLREVATGKQIGQLSGQRLPVEVRRVQIEAAVRFLAFSPDSRVVATSSSQDHKVRFWEVASGKEIGQLGGYKHHGNVGQGQRVGCVLAFSPDGLMLATAEQLRNSNRDLAVTLWEMASGKEIGRLAGHRNVIRTLAFAPDGKTLTSAGDDLTCLIWDVASVAARLKPAATDALSPKSFSKAQLEAVWADLANTDPTKAYWAISALRAAPEQAVLLLKERVQPVAPVADPKQLARWIAELDDESFVVREKAQRAIQSLGEPAIPALRRALADQPALEVKRRLQNILAAIEQKMANDRSPMLLRQIRAVQVLESIATPEAQQVLQSLAKRGVAGVGLTREVQAALERLAKRPTPRP